MPDDAGERGDERHGVVDRPRRSAGARACPGAATRSSAVDAALGVVTSCRWSVSRGDHDAPVGILALGAAGDAVDGGEGVVEHLAVGRRHRIERAGHARRLAPARRRWRRSARAPRGASRGSRRRRPAAGCRGRRADAGRRPGRGPGRRAACDRRARSAGRATRRRRAPRSRCPRRWRRPTPRTRTPSVSPPTNSTAAWRTASTSGCSGGRGCCHRWSWSLLRGGRAVGW